jgi:hypothetical protein
MMTHHVRHRDYSGLSGSALGWLWSLAIVSFATLIRLP